LCGLLVTRGLDQRSCSTSCPVSTRMDNRRRPGEPSKYLANRLGRLSLSFLPSVGR